MDFFLHLKTAQILLEIIHAGKCCFLYRVTEVWLAKKASHSHFPHYKMLFSVLYLTSYHIFFTVHHLSATIHIKMKVSLNSAHAMFISCACVFEDFQMKAECDL